MDENPPLNMTPMVKKFCLNPACWLQELNYSGAGPPRPRWDFDYAPGGRHHKAEIPFLHALLRLRVLINLTALKPSEAMCKKGSRKKIHHFLPGSGAWIEQAPRGAEAAQNNIAAQHHNFQINSFFHLHPGHFACFVLWLPASLLTLYRWTRL